MAEKVCSESSDCRQYCAALDSIGDTSFSGEDFSTCEWPKQINETLKAVDGASGASLISSVAVKLSSVLEIAAAEDPESTRRADYYKGLHGIFTARCNHWDYVAGVVQTGRIPTDAEIAYQTGLIAEAEGVIAALGAGQDRMDEDGKKADKATLTMAQALHDRYMLETHSLMLDTATASQITRIVDNIAHGRHTLLVGDKGIAKTQMAKFAARPFSPSGNPMVISGHGTMMSEEFIGKIDIVDGNTVYHEGKLIQCIESGTPVILDEINLADQQVIMRLQDILLKKPGSTFVLQENGGREITVKRGFSVIATANEASARYNAREQLDPALRDRFDVRSIEFPDIDTPHITDTPAINTRLALAFSLTEGGRENEYLGAQDAVRLAKLAHATQRLYARPAEEVAGSLMDSTSALIDRSEPLLTDCITPRKMVTILERVKAGTLPGVTIDQEIADVIKSLDQHGNHNQTHVEKILELLTRTNP